MFRVAVSATLALALCAAAVQAQPRHQPRQLNVSYAGLDLANAADARVLKGRIHDAAVKVCGPVDQRPEQGITQFMEARETVAACVRQAEAGAYRQLPGPRNPAPTFELVVTHN